VGSAVQSQYAAEGLSKKHNPCTRFAWVNVQATVHTRDSPDYRHVFERGAQEQPNSLLRDHSTESTTERSGALFGSDIVAARKVLVLGCSSRGVFPQNGTCVMKTTLIVIQNDADHAQAKALIEKLMDAKDPADQARMVAQACLTEAAAISQDRCVTT
jgi:hypothetical protein